MDRLPSTERPTLAQRADMSQTKTTQPAGRRAADAPHIGYAEMKRLASALLQRHRSCDRRTTSLVHEAYLRMIRADDLSDYTTRRLLGVAAHAMRSVLIDQVRRRRTVKRGCGASTISISDADIAAALPDDTLLELNDSLVRLQQLDKRKARIVELRYFGGLTTEEASSVLGISTATVKREWTAARAWLFREMTREA